MTINTTLFTEWRNRTQWQAPPYNAPSPNLVAILDYLTVRWGGVSLGIKTKEPVKAGARPRAHHFGAALDWRWQYHSQFPNATFISREVLETEVLPFLIEWSAELGIQAIHDRERIWRSKRNNGVHGWQKYETGYTGWIHTETTPQSFSDHVPVSQRLALAGVDHNWPPIDFGKGLFGLWPLNPNKPTLRRFRVCPPDAVAYAQSVIHHHGGGDIKIDGKYGPQTEIRVKNVQRFFGLTADGIVGSQTWRLLDWMTTL